jgi:hypothetical protein
MAGMLLERQNEKGLPESLEALLAILVRGRKHHYRQLLRLVA